MGEGGKEREGKKGERSCNKGIPGNPNTTPLLPFRRRHTNAAEKMKERRWEEKKRKNDAAGQKSVCDFRLYLFCTFSGVDSGKKRVGREKGKKKEGKKKRRGEAPTGPFFSVPPMLGDENARFWGRGLGMGKERREEKKKGES